MVDGSVINMHRKDKGDMEQSNDIHKKLTVTKGEIREVVKCGACPNKYEKPSASVSYSMSGQALPHPHVSA